MSTRVIMKELPSGNYLVHFIMDDPDPEWTNRYAFRTSVDGRVTDHIITMAEYFALLPLTKPKP